MDTEMEEESQSWLRQQRKERNRHLIGQLCLALIFMVSILLSDYILDSFSGPFSKIMATALPVLAITLWTWLIYSQIPKDTRRKIIRGNFCHNTLGVDLLRTHGRYLYPALLSGHNAGADCCRALADHLGSSEKKIHMKNRVRELRKENGWTQGRLAELLEVSRQNIIAIEKEKYDPSLALALKIARLFEDHVENIFLE